MKKNDFVNLEIFDTTLMGAGVGKHEGLTVFVDASVTGDVVKAHILKVKSNYAFAKIAEIIQPSEWRVDSNCGSYPKCGGCSFRHISYNQELKLKENAVKNNLKHIGKTEPELEPITGLEPDGYRNKAQYPVSFENNELRIGFFAGHSHRVIDCPDCGLQPAEFSKAVKAFRRYIQENSVSVYDESEHKGLIRHIYFRKAVSTGEIMVCVVANGNSIPAKQSLIDAFKNVFGDNLKSVILNENRDKTNVIMGKKCTVLYGIDHITDVLCGVKVRISPLSFYQVNHNVAEKLYEKAAEYAEPQGKTVLDLYCGAGTIGLSMAEKAKKIIGVEIIPEAVEDAEFNAEQNGFDNAEFLCGDASEAAEKLKNDGIKPDVVVVDPPRKGCEPELIRIIAGSFAPERVVYVSCDVGTFSRDIKIFGEKGYTLTEYTPADLFPRTSHCETVALLSQRRPDEHIDITIDLTEFDTTAAELKATYPEIKEYVLNKFGLKVSSLYISQVKTKCGIIERENYNKGKAGHRVPQCPKEKEDAIMDALKHFKMI